MSQNTASIRKVWISQTGQGRKTWNLWGTPQELRVNRRPWCFHTTTSSPFVALLLASRLYTWAFAPGLGQNDFSPTCLCHLDLMARLCIGCLFTSRWPEISWSFVLLHAWCWRVSCFEILVTECSHINLDFGSWCALAQVACRWTDGGYGFPLGGHGNFKRTICTLAWWRSTRTYTHTHTFTHSHSRYFLAMAVVCRNSNVIGVRLIVPQGYRTNWGMRDHKWVNGLHAPCSPSILDP